MIVAIPISVGAAIYLEEYAEPNRITKLIQALVTNLAGVPSIVFGMFGLAVFVQQGGLGWGLGPSILAAGLTMGVMAMPIVVLASQEALRSVPSSLRESAFGVGCTRWQVVRDHIMPSAMPGIMTGSILAMSRIMGEAAPLIVVERLQEFGLTLTHSPLLIVEIHLLISPSYPLPFTNGQVWKVKL